MSSSGKADARRQQRRQRKQLAQAQKKEEAKAADVENEVQRKKFAAKNRGAGQASLIRTSGVGVAAPAKSGAKSTLGGA